MVKCMENINKFRDQIKIFGQMFKEGNWKGARKVLLKLLKDYPEDHWLLTRLSVTYYEEKNYLKALEYVEKARTITSRCPLVLWDYAGTLDMLNNNEDAIRIYKRLIRRGVNRIAYGECGEGISWARSLVNDCRYRLGLIYARMGEFRLARNYLDTHIANRYLNCYSIYNLREVKKDLVDLQNNKDPRNKDIIAI